MKCPATYKPIQNFGIFLVAISVLGFLCLFTEPNNEKGYIFLFFFAGIISVVHLFLGIGVIIRNRKVFVFFKGYLRFLYMGFPVGTYIAKKTLDYIADNNIEQYLL